jgi:ribosome-binding protein aMBF1 (putative translation factor)
MLEAMRESITTEYVEVKFRIPKKKLDEVKEVMASFGAEEAGELLDTVPWEEIYPHFNAGVALRAARKREGLTQKELALSIDVKQSHISEMEKGKRPIGKELAKRLAKALNVDYRVFL